MTNDANEEVRGPISKPRGPGLLYTSSALIVALLVAVIAIAPMQQPPPAIAEFAPTAREPIKDAPVEQTSEFGAGEGGGSGGAGGVAATTTTTTPPVKGVVDKARVRRCVGNPPRQIEDPQSPPCVAFWAGDKNGGVTSKGVTANEIRIAVPYIESGPGQGETELTPDAVAVQEFFNRRFEFYGRKLKLVKFAGKNPDNGNPEPEVQKANAVTADEQIQAFASLPAASQGGADFYYHDELTRRGIVSVYSGWGTAKDEDHFERKHPFQWNIMPGSTTIAANMGEWMCKSIVGQNVSYAPRFNGRPRVYGLILGIGPEGTRPDVGPLTKRLAACGVTIKATVEVPYNSSVDSAQTGVLRLQDEDVTTAIIYAEAAPTFLMIWPAAERLDYRPEWIISSYGNQTEDTAGLLAPRAQLDTAFGLTFLNKNQPPADFPMNYAVKEVDPSLSGEWAQAKYVYWPLLVLASGIQAAGPNLTPKTFGDALQRLKFPNPGAGTAPFYQATVGFGSGDHTFFSDGTPFYWNGSAASYQVGRNTGSFCYTDRGQRYALGQWPTTPSKLFQGPCY